MENLERAQSPSASFEKDAERAPEERELLHDLFTKEQIEVLKERTKGLVERVAEDDCRLVVFLDRSARPISWMFRAAWKKYADGKPLPKIKFANIGTEKTKLKLGKGYPDAYPPVRYLFRTEREYEEKAREYWSEFNAGEYSTHIKQDVGDVFSETRDAKRGVADGGKILIVDDFIASGETADLARHFFEHIFPDVSVETVSFLARDDAKIFRKENFRGAYLPWNTDKSLTLLKGEETHPERLTAEAERDAKKRARGVELKEELEALFSAESTESNEGAEDVAA